MSRRPQPDPTELVAPASLGDMLADKAARQGERIALQVLRQGAWVRLSYRELVARAQGWARELNLPAGARVLLAAESSPEWGVAYFAAMFGGATVVPLDPQLGAADMQAIAGRTGVVVWLVSAAVAERVRAEGDAEQPLYVIDDWLDTPLPAESGSELPPPGEPASIPFTSGTTLAPKGVPLTHANFLANVRGVLWAIHVRPEDEFLCALPLHHVLAFTACFLTPLQAGATVTFAEKVTPKAMLEAIQGSRTTVLIAVPRLFALFVRGIKSNLETAPFSRRALFAVLSVLARGLGWLGVAIPPLAPALRALRAALFRRVHQRFGGRIRYLVSGGAALPPEYYDALDRLGFRVAEGYGLTETSPVLTLTPPERPRRGTVGPPLAGVAVRLAEPDADGIGEVLAQGPSVFSGYLDDPEATQQAFVDGWFRTGDLGWLDRRGYLRLAGRADDVIVTGGGKNVYPVEVEWLYHGLPHVKEFCALGLSDPGTAGEAVHGVVVLEAMEGGDDARRRQEVEAAITSRARQLAPHQRLRGVHFWEGDLPRTPTLKIKRREIRAALLAAGEPAAERTPSAR